MPYTDVYCVSRIQARNESLALSYLEYVGECRGAVKLYSDFLQSDIVVASPIALATKLSDEQMEEEGGPADFLSSIEIAIVDRADVLLMQNWAHVVTGLPPLLVVGSAQHDQLCAEVS